MGEGGFLYVKIIGVAEAVHRSASASGSLVAWSYKWRFVWNAGEGTAISQQRAQLILMGKHRWCRALHEKMILAMLYS